MKFNNIADFLHSLPDINNLLNFVQRSQKMANTNDVINELKDTRAKIIQLTMRESELLGQLVTTFNNAIVNNAKEIEGFKKLVAEKKKLDIEPDKK